MICPGCNKESFYDVSICVTCGTMVNDSIREELASKITRIENKLAPQIILKGNPAVQNKAIQAKIEPKSNEISVKDTKTTEISVSQTSPTLVEFQSKNPQLPEWRLQLQNAVKQRFSQNETNSETISQTETISAVKNYQTQGNTALKVEAEAVTNPDEVENLHLKKALERIERSRKTFLKIEPEKPKEKVEENSKSNNHKLRIATKEDKPAPLPKEQKSSVNFPTKPKLVPKPEQENKINLYDTSELDPEFIPAKVSSSFEKTPTVNLEKEEPKAESEIKVETKVETKDEIVEKKETTDIESAEIEDMAPFSLRFNAGLFDMIIGSFLSLILLSPFMLLGGNWFTIAGFFAFLATCSIVMFIYQTTTIGIFGKTFGMHLFSLEMIDIDGESYPTFHQAAVSSSIYLLSLAFFGLGFITSFFDEEKRSIHDIVSGTLVVKEI